jgi:hypothetical protein
MLSYYGTADAIWSFLSNPACFQWPESELDHNTTCSGLYMWPVACHTRLVTSINCQNWPWKQVLPLLGADMGYGVGLPCSSHGVGSKYNPARISFVSNVSIPVKLWSLQSTNLSLVIIKRRYQYTRLLAKRDKQHHWRCFIFYFVKLCSR